MIKRNGIEAFIVAVVTALATGGANCKGQTDVPDQPEPGPPSLWCEKMPVHVWELGQDVTLLRTASEQLLVLPAALRVGPCIDYRSIAIRIPTDCLASQCAQFERDGIPGQLMEVFAALEEVKPTVYELAPGMAPSGVDPQVHHWVGPHHEVVQMSRALDMRRVLDTPPGDGDVGPFSGRDCVPCNCNGSADPGPREHVWFQPNCSCPAREDRAAACAQIGCGEECSCFAACCEGQQRSCETPDE